MIQAYALGKGQEVTRLLTAANIPVLQHQAVYAVSKVYEACGVRLGEYGRLGDKSAVGCAVIVPPGAAWGSTLDQIAGGSVKAGRPAALRTVTIAVTGWAVQRAPSTGWASITPCRCRTMPTTTSFSRPLPA